MKFRTEEELNLALPRILDSPVDEGSLESIVLRPMRKMRRVVERCALSPTGGLAGDRWVRDCWLKLDSGESDPDVQISMINVRLIEFVAGDKERRSLSGDNLTVDLDLSREQLHDGQRLAIGDAVLEITDQKHSACGSFAERFGKDAARFINSAQGRELRLRGVFARVIRAGEIRVGDPIRKI